MGLFLERPEYILLIRVQSILEKKLLVLLLTDKEVKLIVCENLADLFHRLRLLSFLERFHDQIW